VDHTYNFNEVVSLDSTNPDFSYWADADGQIISTNNHFRFSALAPREIYEVSGVFTPDIPRIYLSNVTGIRDGEISLQGYIDHSRSDIVEYGILASSQEAVLNIDNSTKIPSNALSPTNEYLRTFVGDTYKSFRAYAILSNNSV